MSTMRALVSDAAITMPTMLGTLHVIATQQHRKGMVGGMVPGKTVWKEHGRMVGMVGADRENGGEGGFGDVERGVTAVGFK